MRTAFIQALNELADKDERVCLIVGDLGYSVIDDFAMAVDGVLHRTKVRFGGENAPEVVRGESHRAPVRAGDPGRGGGVVEEFLDPHGSEAGVGQPPRPLEEERAAQ